MVYHRHRLLGAGAGLKRGGKCPFNVSSPIRKAIQSAPVEIAARWQSHGLNLPVLDGARPTPRQAEVSVSARQLRQIRKISAPLAGIVDIATVSPQTRTGRT
jgi:hypothetical protein